MFDGGPLGPFSERFTFVHELGCAFNVVCFVLFVMAVLIFWRYALN